MLLTAIRNTKIPNCSEPSNLVVRIRNIIQMGLDTKFAAPNHPILCEILAGFRVGQLRGFQVL